MHIFRFIHFVLFILLIFVMAQSVDHFVMEFAPLDYLLLLLLITFLLCAAGLTKCQRERQLTLGWSGQARQDAFVPDCSSDGNYENVQCHEATGFCWCVDGNGNEIAATRQRGRPVCTKQGVYNQQGVSSYNHSWTLV